MPDTPNIKVLVVDDLPEKLLVYRSVLEEPGIEVILARSGSEALRQVLQHDFAVILLDVNMPDMDGYEAAGLIRTRRRSSHTPIIFITAYADELHAIKGYSYGAVDYILSPVAPDVLRTKVRVFVDLFRKNLEVQRQAEALRELQTRQHRREMRETHARLQLALDAGRMGTCEWELVPTAASLVSRIEQPAAEARAAPLDISDFILRLASWSPMLETIFGYEPGQFSGSAQELAERLHPADRDLVLQTLLNAMRTGNDFQIEHRVVRNRQAAGAVAPAASEGAAAAVDESQVAWIELRGKVFADEHGEPVRFAGVCMDITLRKRTEAELAEHRARLEDLVRERTAELQASHERLRLADRLASIGTLAAGLGHDMGNLLLPIRARLASLERMPLPSAAQEDIKAIKTAGEYLKRLSQGLRLFALDPIETDTGETTSLAAWWPDVEPFLRNTLPKGVTLEAAFSDDLPPIDIPPHTFTQVIYNLVQNAGDAMRDRGHGAVRLGAAVQSGQRPAARGGGAAALASRPMLRRTPAGPDEDVASWSILVTVSDNDPGMTEEVRQRCMEPFFTTRTRRISTGLGLALVRGAIGNAQGTVEITSSIGEGTTFRLVLPSVDPTVAIDAPDGGMDRPTQRAALVALSDRRLGAYIASLLRSMRMEVRIEPWSPDRATDARLLVLDNVNGAWSEIEHALSADRSRRALVLAARNAPEHAAARHPQVAWIEPPATPARIREALAAATAVVEANGEATPQPAHKNLPRATVALSSEP